MLFLLRFQHNKKKDRLLSNTRESVFYICCLLELHIICEMGKTILKLMLHVYQLFFRQVASIIGSTALLVSTSVYTNEVSFVCLQRDFFTASEEDTVEPLLTDTPLLRTVHLVPERPKSI